MTHSYKPQDISKEAWYYENDGSIDIIINPQSLNLLVQKTLKPAYRRKKGVLWSDPDGISIRIPSSMLLKTLKRQEIV